MLLNRVVIKMSLQMKWKIVKSMFSFLNNAIDLLSKYNLQAIPI